MMHFIKVFLANPIVSFLNIFSGGGFASIGIFALGIVPYINASIIIQLATTSIPSLERLQKEEGEAGRQKISQITRYIALGWATMQSIGVSFWVRPYVFNWDTQFVIQNDISFNYWINAHHVVF